MIHTIIATLFKQRKIKDADIRKWAETEYKKDADFAYNQMITHGFMIDFKVNR